MTSGDRAARVIVVSLMKSGTHMVQRLMAQLGYGIYGESHISRYERPDLDIASRSHIARLVYGIEMPLEISRDEFIAQTDLAWSALGWAWQLRLGMPLANHYGMDVTHSDLVQETLRRTLATSFSETPVNLCWILPRLDIEQVDGAFLREWAATGEPKIIFNYRDPRDAVLSMVNFLAGRTEQGYGTFSDFAIHSEVLKSRTSLDDQLTYALTDPAFPGLRDFERGLWLLHHPAVCTVSFEELVGPEGGGTTEAQLRAVDRIIAFTGASAAAEDLAGSLFRRDSFSFYKGQIGAWRESFTCAHRDIMTRRLGHVLSAYGYP